MQKRGGNSFLKTHTPNKLWTHNVACQRLFKTGKWQRYFEVKADVANIPAPQNNDQRNAFFQIQRENIARAEQDAANGANRFRGFGDHRSTVVPWLRETGIVNHLRGLKKDEIRAATALSSRKNDSSHLPCITKGSRVHVTRSAQLLL